MEEENSKFLKELEDFEKKTGGDKVEKLIRSYQEKIKEIEAMMSGKQTTPYDPKIEK